MGRKKTWYASTTDFLSRMVNWHCRTTGVESPLWARYVDLNMDMDGREIILPLTPGEARALGRQLIRQADRVDAMNTEQRDGGVYPAERDWAVTEV